MKKLSYILKSSQILYDIYFYVMSALLRLLGLFVPVDDKLILFNSYGGKKYDDSPKAIYERMLGDTRFDRYKLVWALQAPDKTRVSGRAEVIKADSFQYFVTALKAKVWVTNSSMERGLDFKKKKTVCFNTWHGSAIKVMGVDIKADNQSFRSRVLVRADIMLAQSQYDIDVFSHAFQLPASRFCMTGLPRNDVLSNYTQDEADRIREKLGIDRDKIILLYAPTFREYTKGASNEVILNIPIDLQYWQDTLGDKYVILFRAHYEVARHMNVDSCSLFIDVSAYPNLNELMIVSDALISDYSSIFFDYSIMHKPMCCFAYDYDEYYEKRGMYIDLREEAPFQVHFKEETLLEELLNLQSNYNKKSIESKQFQEKYVTEFGNASELCCSKLIEILNNSTETVL